MGERSLEVYVEAGGFNYKRCSKCKVYKSFSEFSHDAKMRYKVSSYCKSCNRLLKRAALLENPEKVRKQKKDWRLANYEKNKLEDKLRGEKYRQTEKYKQTQASYKARNAEMFKRLNDKHSRKRVDELHLSYVKQLMTDRSSMPAHKIPDSLALAYKEVIKINRHLKETMK